MPRHRSKYGVRLDTGAVKLKEAELVAQGRTKKEAALQARLFVYPERSADGIFFASKKECAHYRQLKLMLTAGEIRDLKLQVRFNLHVNGHKIAEYVADMTYYDKSGVYVICDVKGRMTDLYVHKKKHIKAEYGIDILEV